MEARALAVGLALFACSAPSSETLLAKAPFELARSHGRFVEAGGVTLFTISLGEGNPLVLLHGNGASAYTWRRVIRPLGNHYRVHAIDLPGYGLSEKPPVTEFDPAWFSVVVVAFLSKVGSGRATIVGNSMGGYIATEIALRHPDRVAGLVLLGASGIPGRDRKELPWSYRVAAWPVVGPVLRALAVRSLVRRSLERAVYDPAEISDADVEAYSLPLRSSGGYAAYLALTRHLVPQDRADRLQALTAPTLIITGKEDRFVAPKFSKRYHQLISGSEFLLLEETGHLPQEERPERVVAAILRWRSEMSSR